MAHQTWNIPSGGSGCIVTVADMPTLQSIAASGTLQPGCIYHVPNLVQGTLGPFELYAIAVTSTHVADTCWLVTAFDTDDAWAGTFDLSSGLVTSVRDNMNNDVSGIGAVSSFPWGSPTWDSVTARNSLFSVTGNEIVSSCTFDECSILTFPGPIGLVTMANSNFIASSVVFNLLPSGSTSISGVTSISSAIAIQFVYTNLTISDVELEHSTLSFTQVENVTVTGSRFGARSNFTLNDIRSGYFDSISLDTRSVVVLSDNGGPAVPPFSWQQVSLKNGSNVLVSTDQPHQLYQVSFDSTIKFVSANGNQVSMSNTSMTSCVLSFTNGSGCSWVQSNLTDTSMSHAFGGYSVLDRAMIHGAGIQVQNPSTSIIQSVVTNATLTLRVSSFFLAGSRIEESFVNLSPFAVFQSSSSEIARTNFVSSSTDTNGAIILTRSSFDEANFNIDANSTGQVFFTDSSISGILQFVSNTSPVSNFNRCVLQNDSFLVSTNSGNLTFSGVNDTGSVFITGCTANAMLSNIVSSGTVSLSSRSAMTSIFNSSVGGAGSLTATGANPASWTAFTVIDGAVSGTGGNATRVLKARGGSLDIANFNHNSVMHNANAADVLTAVNVNRSRDDFNNNLI